jgi:hypothetical protein
METQAAMQHSLGSRHFYHTTWCNVLEDSNLRNNCNENLITHAKYIHMNLSSHNGVYLDCGLRGAGTSCSLVGGYQEI